MSLPLATLKELRKLSNLKAKGVIIERKYEVIKKHVTEGNSLTNENWEALDATGFAFTHLHRQLLTVRYCGVEYSLLGMGWFGRLINRQSQERTRNVYDYRVHLDLDQRARSMKLPLEMYSGDPYAVAGSSVLLKRSTAEQVEGGGAAATLGVSRVGRVRTPNVTLMDQEG